MANPNLFDTVTSASGGTSIHWPSSRTRYFPSFESQSTSEQQGPLRLARLSNHCLSGEFEYFPLGSRARPVSEENSSDSAAQQIMLTLTNDTVNFAMQNSASNSGRDLPSPVYMLEGKPAG